MAIVDQAAISWACADADPIDVVRQTSEGQRELVLMRWGLVPRWWSKPLKELRAVTFNARAETVETRPFFRDAFRHNRCLIPLSGYYEWQSTPGGKQPWYYTARDESTLAAAGLWDSWRNPETGQPLLSCTMIVTEPNAIAAEIHDRMPALLTQQQFEPWLRGEAGLANISNRHRTICCKSGQCRRGSTVQRHPPTMQALSKGWLHDCDTMHL